ncbi:bestrophin family protein [Larkinella bovis]|uniref:Bestrophin family protein n=1 Tax=Larkinella bovis TaxID=683041 RepID=A0ABW0IK59_9BACT
MYVKHYFNYKIIYFISWRLLLWSLFTGSLALFTYQYLGWKWVSVPWLPVSLIGTAVAFYVGFKNNQSYDRSWEARKIWGGIVNTSRSLGASCRAFLTGKDTSVPPEEVNAEIRCFIYRHLAWLYALKHAMWQRTPWEHQQMDSVRQRNFFRQRIHFSSFEEEATRCLSPDELAWINTKKNKATQLLDRQAQHLAALKNKGWLTDFEHITLQNLLNDLYNEQGRSERIKNSPLPRQYATSSAIFIFIFTFLLPFGMLKEFESNGPELIWLLLPFNLVVSWVFSLMEYTGDYSENPFEGMINDVPIQSIVRTIEIDLKDMLGETELPERMQPVENVLF